MRSLLLALALALPAAAQNQPLLPSGWKAISMDKWGGLNLLSDSSMIGDDAQQAQNVLTDNFYLEKRPGNVRLATILAGYPVQYANDWVGPNGNRYLIAQASSTIYQTNFSGSPVALSTVAIGFNITTVPAFSQIYFSDGSRPIWSWNDVSTGTVTDAATGNLAPVCTYIDFKDNRLWCANLPVGFSVSGNTQNGGGSSTVLLSSAGGAGFWSVPSNVGQVDSTPNRFDFNPNDGDQITCLAKTPWGEFVGKRNSSYIVKGNGNLSYDPRLLDPKIGCVDNRSVQMVYGMLTWLAVDGVYGYGGSGHPELLTRELDPLMQTVREATFSQGQWATHLQPDWATGTESTTTASLPAQGPWDFGSISGSIFPSSGTLYDDNTSPQLQNCSTNINPANSLPWSCGVGFSSDTLVNIDTTSFPLSIGLAQVAASSSGINVWKSNFAGGNYTTIPTTWTASAGSFAGLTNGMVASGWQCSGGMCPGGPFSATAYTMTSSSPNAPGNGWMTGYWGVAWVPSLFTQNGSGSITGISSYGQCSSGASAPCFEFNFVADQIPSSSWNGYGIDVNQNSCSGSVCNYSANIFKEIIGAKTVLNTGTFNLNVTGSYVATSTIAVTRNSGGFITVFLGTTPVVSALDNSAGITKSELTSLTLNADFGSSYAFNAVYNIAQNGYGTGSVVSRIYDTGTITPLAGVLSSSYTLQGVQSGGAPESEIDFYLRDSTSPNNDMWSSWQASSNSVLAALPLRYWQYEALFTSRIASATVQLQSVELSAVTTGYYYSKVNYIGPLITSWTQFGVTENTPGTFGYAVRAATYAFSPGAASPAWVAQTANQNVNLSVSTPTWAQFRLSSTPLISNPRGASASEAISAVFLRWNQGANIPVTSDTLERRYIICVTISTSATSPDTCLLRQKTGKWIPWTTYTTIGAMGYYNNQQIAAAGDTSSNVWLIMQPNVYSDDGVPINSFWVGADEADGLPFNAKTYYGAMVDAQPVLGSTVTYSYSMSKTSVYVAHQFATDNGQALDPMKPVLGSQLGTIDQWLTPDNTGYNKGNYIRAMFSDSTLDNYFRINNFMIFVHDEPWAEP
jgi:hypothetical protein